MRPVILVFAKAPVPGRVKTRLTPPLSPEQAVHLHLEMVRAVFRMLEPFRAGADLELHTDKLTDAWPELEVTRKLQVTGDLGIKMRSALECALAAGRPRVLLLGSDSPTLPPAHVEALLASSADVALGPTEDGGYYAIACRRVSAGMFDGVRWSQPTTLTDTINACAKCGLSVQIGPPWYDIDTMEDLKRWKSDI